MIRFSGVVTGVLPEGQYQVRFTNGHEITAAALAPDRFPADIGDAITVEISPGSSGAPRPMFRQATPVGLRAC